MIQLAPDKPDLDIEALFLKSGGHTNLQEGACVMEAVAFLAGETWSDHPQCACPVISAFLRRWNDRLPDDERQQLKQYILPLIGSRGSKELECRRSWAITDWVVRECAPIWLRRAGMVEQAEIMEGIKPLTDSAGYQSVRPAILAIRAECWERRRGFRAKMTEAVKAAYAKNGLSGVADAAAADAAAAAAAAADADAAADAADAAAAAAAAAADAAAADAAADAAAWGTSRWRMIYDKVYAAVIDTYRKHFAETRAVSAESAHRLVKRLLEMKD